MQVQWWGYHKVVGTLKLFHIIVLKGGGDGKTSASAHARAQRWWGHKPNINVALLLVLHPSTSACNQTLVLMLALMLKGGGPHVCTLVSADAQRWWAHIGRVRVSPPPQIVTNTRAAFILSKTVIHRSPPPPKILGPKAKSNH